MPIMFDQTMYIESTKGIVKEFAKEIFPDYDFPLGMPDLSDDNIILVKPVINIEYNSSQNIDAKSGRNNGKGQRVKRKILRFSFQILTTGENSAILDRDRIAQTLEAEFAKDVNVKRFASQGMKEVDLRYVNSYRVREGVHLARLELFAEISLIN